MNLKNQSIARFEDHVRLQLERNGLPASGSNIIDLYGPQKNGQIAAGDVWMAALCIGGESFVLCNAPVADNEDMVVTGSEIFLLEAEPVVFIGGLKDSLLVLHEKRMMEQESARRFSSLMDLHGPGSYQAKLAENFRDVAQGYADSALHVIKIFAETASILEKVQRPENRSKPIDTIQLRQQPV